MADVLAAPSESSLHVTPALPVAWVGLFEFMHAQVRTGREALRQRTTPRRTPVRRL